MQDFFTFSKKISSLKKMLNSKEKKNERLHFLVNPATSFCHQVKRSERKQRKLLKASKYIAIYCIFSQRDLLHLNTARIRMGILRIKFK